jgi:hypothetical protein
MAVTLDQIKKRRPPAIKVPTSNAAAARRLMPWETFNDQPLQPAASASEIEAKGNNKGEQAASDVDAAGPIGWVPSRRSFPLAGPDEGGACGAEKFSAWPPPVQTEASAVEQQRSDAAKNLVSEAQTGGNNGEQQREPSPAGRRGVAADVLPQVPKEFAREARAIPAKGNNKGEQDSPGGDLVVPTSHLLATPSTEGLRDEIEIERAKGNNKGEQRYPREDRTSPTSHLLTTRPTEGLRDEAEIERSKGNNKGEQTSPEPPERPDAALDKPHSPTHISAASSPVVSPKELAAVKARELNDWDKGEQDFRKGEQTSQQRGTKGNNKGEQHEFKGEQASFKRGTKDARASAAPNLKGEQTPQQRGTKGNTKGEQTGVVPLSDRICSPLQTSSFPFDFPKPSQGSSVVPLSVAYRSPLQRGTDLASKGEQIPSSPQQRQLLLFLAEKQAATGLRVTPLLRKSDISADLGMPLESLKVQIKRLKASSYIEVVHARHGRGDAGCVYRVSEGVIELALLIKEEQRETAKGNSKGEQQRGTPGGSSSSRSLNIPTTTSKTPDRQLADMFATALQRVAFDDVLGPNDMLQAWRFGVFENPGELIESMEHLASYLKASTTKGIDSPKAFAMSQLKRGYYAPPVGFKSWQALEEEAKTAAKQARLSQLKDALEKAFGVDFELWLHELADSERTKIIEAAVGAGASYMPAKVTRSVLRNHYATQRGLFEFIEDDGPTK